MSSDNLDRAMDDLERIIDRYSIYQINGHPLIMLDSVDSFLNDANLRTTETPRAGDRLVIRAPVATGGRTLSILDIVGIEEKVNWQRDGF